MGTITIHHQRLRPHADNGELLEWAEVFDNCYGTPRSRSRTGAQGRDVLFDIDWQGTQQIARCAPTSSASSSCRRARKSCAPASSAVPRYDGAVICRAAEERRRRDRPLEREYDYVLVNEDSRGELSTRLRAILTAERLKRVLQARHLQGFVAELLADLRKITP